MFWKKNIIEFHVYGKPPKKTTGSIWSVKSTQTDLVINLRQKAFDASQEKGLKEPIQGPVRLELIVYASNILERKDRHDYLGDLDALVGGIFESLQPAPKNNPELDIDPKLKNGGDIASDKPIIVSDDAQITSIVAKKIKNEKPSYTVIIEKDSSSNS